MLIPNENVFVIKIMAAPAAAATEMQPEWMQSTIATIHSANNCVARATSSWRILTDCRNDDKCGK